MNQSSSLEAVSLQDSWLTIGVFDGVHRGHQEIIRQLIAGAHLNGAPAVLLTFSPHPARVLAGKDIPCLTTPAERAEILASLGLDELITLPFTRETAARSAEDFIVELKTRLGLKKLLIGYDFALGKNRAGDFQRLSELGRQLDFETRAVDAIRLNGEILSSTLIRQSLLDGAVALAAEKLGRCYTLTGPIVPGDARGRTIGIPTANVEFPAEKVVPANGVYACRAWVDGQRHSAVTNIGVRPTFTSGDVATRVETHLLDYSADLYGKILRLEFVERLRGEQKFTSVEALVAQIRADISRARQILSGGE
jgi:riboflavin kinase/FMN adenylyltransferase